MKKIVRFSVLILIATLYFRTARADILELSYTIQTPLDSTEIKTIAPVGDFNADGYGDLALGIFGVFPNRYEGVYLYYGGPNFDDQADLIFYGLPQNTIICGAPEDSYTGFGGEITGLGDYNGDGYDDFAVGASNLCYQMTLNGAVYIYFGSPFPDTTADIFIPGEEAWDDFGAVVVNGNFNGDQYGDLLTISYGWMWFQKVYIFLGSDPANGLYDWRLNFLDTPISVGFIRGGRDINDDGYDDFSWDFDDYLNFTDGTMLFFGGDPIDTLPYAVMFDTLLYFEDDISGDGVDDFIISTFDTQPYLDHICLGGSPFNTIPECEIPIHINFLIPSIFTLPSGERKFIMDDGVNRRINFYEPTVPIDTNSFVFYYYGNQSGRWPGIIGNIDDIPGDEIIMTDYDRQSIFIYSGIQTGIGENNGDLELPEKKGIISVYPNPFNAACRITVSDPSIEFIEIYDITGRQVERVHLKRGVAIWDGSKQTSGVYFARAGTGDYSSNIKIVLLK